MEIVRISAVWCSSCIIMKQRFNEIMKDYDVNLIDLDYDLDYEKIEKYQIGDVLPVYIKGDLRLVGEHTKNEIKEFLEV